MKHRHQEKEVHPKFCRHLYSSEISGFQGVKDITCRKRCPWSEVLPLGTKKAGALESTLMASPPPVSPVAPHSSAWNSGPTCCSSGHSCGLPLPKIPFCQVFTQLGQSGLMCPLKEADLKITPSHSPTTVPQPRRFCPVQPLSLPGALHSMYSFFSIYC